MTVLGNRRISNTTYKSNNSYNNNNKPSKPVGKSQSMNANGSPGNHNGSSNVSGGGNKGPSPSRIPVLKKATSLPATSMQPLVKDYKHHHRHQQQQQQRRAWPLAPFPPVFTPASPRTKEQCEAFYNSWAIRTEGIRDNSQSGEFSPSPQLEQTF